MDRRHNWLMFIRLCSIRYGLTRFTAVLVTAASIDDAKAAAVSFSLLDGQPMSHVKRMYADSNYHQKYTRRMGIV